MSIEKREIEAEINGISGLFTVEYEIGMMLISILSVTNTEGEKVSISSAEEMQIIAKLWAEEIKDSRTNV